MANARAYEKYVALSTDPHRVRVQSVRHHNSEQRYNGGWLAAALVSQAATPVSAGQRLTSSLIINNLYNEIRVIRNRFNERTADGVHNTLARTRTRNRRAHPALLAFSISHANPSRPRTKHGSFHALRATADNSRHTHVQMLLL